MISILIATKDRSEKLKQCIDSILLSSYKDFEVIVLDQSSRNNSYKVTKSFNISKVKYIKFKVPGKSKAINKGSKIARGEIITMTDDDCIVDREWLKSIDDYFKRHSFVVGVFGQTLPYHPKENIHSICPAIFNKTTETKKAKASDVFCLVLGQGNNVSYRKSVFIDLGGLNDRFGPGANIPTAEDCEFIYRAIMNGHTLAFTPKALVYHNRWITPLEDNKLQIQYTTGICACTIYLIRHLHSVAFLNLVFYKFDEHVTKKINFRMNKSHMILIIKQLLAMIRGIYLGLRIT